MMIFAIRRFGRIRPFCAKSNVNPKGLFKTGFTMRKEKEINIRAVHDGALSLLEWIEPVGVSAPRLAYFPIYFQTKFDHRFVVFQVLSTHNRDYL